MLDILSMNQSEISGLMTELNQPAYRAKQVFEWLHKRGVGAFAQMENLPKALRAELEGRCAISTVEIIETHISKRDDTAKFLTRLSGGELSPAFVESVKMSYKHGKSLCISTQAGCRMGCTFCQSAVGFQRNLTAGEYCAQVYNATPVSNIVLMGCGEPLDNFPATLRFIELITHPDGMNIGQRHITLSTCGLVPEIYELAERRLQITLAVSLHAPTDEMRQRLMPIAKKHPLCELLPACRHYAEKTGRRITFEYALIQGQNDGAKNAKALAKLLEKMLCHVNLIPLNKARGNYTPATRREAEIFAAILRENGVSATLRRSMGGDIAAACGQLRAGREVEVRS